ncbi:uncharacterized protein [Oryza sativa Japonica Group]|uniref:Os04g0458800 protein n=3 Tax=Oryza sativa TaxID=4530 RepID=Q0JCP3_ORYSJ|nr:uncharacterized protein LOC4336040 [Oryza sativa Japonica Group]KAB8095602.1 hypothetical protein EE612_023729 [Oryza sativa]EEE61118.1 hypothetical protein OsJ_15043 [Oryza sativa Japonica Group]KAF2934316.1 hypothetical protein DAI22_04g154300 [Oryza sativa Japonica Group]CAH67074.1 OSIGBa0097P08.4 [Oryza sativa]BAF14894.1 Os04g0458800 [Oryza sativa Japonica Group]|eukprot:NP_001052980.1 Os04g0458800 [Oryza sativa Japonica Group]
MDSIQRQDSFDDLINLADDVVVEAPTLSSEEMDRARREALEILRNNSPEEAFRIFTQGLIGQVVQSPVVGNATTPPTTNQAVTVSVPPKAGDGEPKTAPRPPNN